ncbi:MAG: mechanosensitive ion channel family protein [Alysiella sp.]|uniref:mechanosensitive ion channel family protein n=1 Tax=Alysiella sp. TaxID=1872483 RepID=UPI0026DC7866|nr:mechanosensitive ion channel family protein [Alysiella sp.]MDO4434506.1 mechanosensitive ion channel family protein [Alysiella sp.]
MEVLQNGLNILKNSPISQEWVLSLLLVPLVVILRSILLRVYFRHHPEQSIDEKRRLLVASRNTALAVCLFGLLTVWASQIQTFALSMVALAAATVVATKELIMCLSGSLLRIVTKQYSVGDYIEINHMRGRVVDINLFNTLMMQIGPNAWVGQLSGKTVSFPNSLLLSHAVERDNVLGNYVVHSFDIPVPIHLDSDAIVPELWAVLSEKCHSHSAEIAHYLEEVQAQRLFITPAAQPRISRVPHDDKVYRLVVRFASPVAQRLEIQQAVLDEFIRVQYRLLNPHLEAK